MARKIIARLAAAIALALFLPAVLADAQSFRWNRPGVGARSEEHHV